MKRRRNNNVQKIELLENPTIDWDGPNDQFENGLQKVNERVLRNEQKKKKRLVEEQKH